MVSVATTENSSASFSGGDFELGSSTCYLRADDGNEPEAKRWKGEDENFDLSVSGTITIRERRIIVQTTRAIDVVDDGYGWRKYEQMVVKGNLNPRSYYKRTYNSCSVRKHIERASHNLRKFITTYEGKHNHDVPASRGSCNCLINRPAPELNRNTNTAPIAPWSSGMSSQSGGMDFQNQTPYSFRCYRMQILFQRVMETLHGSMLIRCSGQKMLYPRTRLFFRLIYKLTCYRPEYPWIHQIHMRLVDS